VTPTTEHHWGANSSVILSVLGSEGDRYLPLGSGYQTDESVGSAESFRTCYEGEHRGSES